MAKYIVTAGRYRPPTKVDKKGNITVGPRVGRGAVVEISEEYAAPLVATGGLRLADGSPEVEDDTTDPTPEADSGAEPEDETDEDESDEDETEPEAMPNLEAMSYQDLQHLAKTKTDDGGGSKAELIARLTKHYSA